MLKGLVWIEGVPHRWRRGKLVPIPPEWFAKIPFPQNIEARASKQPRKTRRRNKRPFDATTMYRKDKASRAEARRLSTAED